MDKTESIWSITEWLLSALSGHKLPTVPQTSDPWSEILTSATRHGLAPILWDGLHDHPDQASLPAEFMNRLRILYIANAGRNLNLTNELELIVQKLNVAGIQPTLLKGIVLTHSIYSKPAQRTMGDIDLWVPKAQLPQARLALADLDYKTKDKVGRPPALQEEFNGEIQFFGRRPGIGLVELHWNIFPGEWLRHTTRIDESIIWSRTIPCPGINAKKLSPEDMVLHVCVHAAVNHQMSKNCLRSLLDVEMMRRQRIVNWDLVAERAHAWRVRNALWMVLVFVQEWFGSEPELPLKALSPSFIVQRILRRFVSLASMADGHFLTNGPMRFLYLLVLVDHPTDALRLAWHAVFPERRWLIARYQLANASTLRISLQRLWHPLQSIFRKNL
ncbi:MAG: nucleotidyltransferase family protein [Candidatus Aminicenantes bacterium]|nr:nucleotidyltransferase family protein [Candidatus Aminicenantes bacterium]